MRSLGGVHLLAILETWRRAELQSGDEVIMSLNSLTVVLPMLKTTNLAGDKTGICTGTVADKYVCYFCNFIKFIAPLIECIR